MTEQWHSISSDEALRALDSRRSGLTENEAKQRFLQYGPNELKGKKKTPPLLVFLRQFLSPLIYVLLTAVIISVIVEHFLDAWVILGVLLLTGGFPKPSFQGTDVQFRLLAIHDLAAKKTLFLL